jgi:hypothetical protein
MASFAWLSPAVLLGGTAVAFLVLLFVILRTKAGLAKQLLHEQSKWGELETQLVKANKQVLELRSVAMGLGQRLTAQEDIIALLNERIVELEQEDTDSRLYSRASKMVQLGADINEVISECELPKAEAELMYSLQQKLAGKQQIPPLSSHPEHGRDTPPEPSPRIRKNPRT